MYPHVVSVHYKACQICYYFQINQFFLGVAKVMWDANLASKLVIPLNHSGWSYNVHIICIHIYMDLAGGLEHFFIFHNIWDNPSHWLIFFKMVKTTSQVCMCPLYLHEISTLTDPGFRCRNAPGWWLQLHGLSQLPSALLLELRSGAPRFSAGLSEASEAWLVNEWLQIFCHIIRPLKWVKLGDHLMN